MSRHGQVVKAYICRAQELLNSLKYKYLVEAFNMSGRVFLKRHFVKNQKAHPITQQGDTQEEHIQKERLNKQV